MTTDREQIIAAAKEAGFKIFGGRIVAAENGSSGDATTLCERLYAIAFKAGVDATVPKAFAATSAQSLARLRNQAIEKCAVELDGHWDMAAGIIRAMKEPE